MASDERRVDRRSRSNSLSRNDEIYSGLPTIDIGNKILIVQTDSEQPLDFRLECVIAELKSGCSLKSACAAGEWTFEEFCELLDNDVESKRKVEFALAYNRRIIEKLGLKCAIEYGGSPLIFLLKAMGGMTDKAGLIELEKDMEDVSGITEELEEGGFDESDLADADR